MSKSLGCGLVFQLTVDELAALPQIQTMANQIITITTSDDVRLYWLHNIPEIHGKRFYSTRFLPPSTPGSDPTGGKEGSSSQH